MLSAGGRTGDLGSGTRLEIRPLPARQGPLGRQFREEVHDPGIIAEERLKEQEAIAPLRVLLERPVNSIDRATTRPVLQEDAPSRRVSSSAT